MRPRSFQRSIMPSRARAGQRRSSIFAAAMTCFSRRSWSSVSRIVKLDGQPDRLGVAAQNARGERVKRAEPDAFGGAADHRFEPLAHLARRLVGKGDRQHFAGIGAAARQNMRETGRQDAGFPGAGAGQHQHGAVHRRDSPCLRLVERGEQRIRSIGRRVAGSDDARSYRTGYSNSPASTGTPCRPNSGILRQDRPEAACSRVAQKARCGAKLLQE